MRRPARSALAALAALTALAVASPGCGDDGPDGGQRPDDARAATAPPAEAPTPKAIDAAGIREHLQALQRIADRSGGNRAAGTDGERRTADYVAGRLRAAGWRVRLQAVAVPYFELRGTPRLGALRHERGFSVLQYSGAGAFTGRIRPFDTLGCRAADLGRLQRRDIVLLPRGTCTFARKARSVREAGGGALVVVDRDARRPFTGSLADPAAGRIPVLGATGAAAARLTAAGGPVRVAVDTVSERRTTRNVLAETDGTETATTPAARVAMAGAHLDSVEEGPGLNDDGSGIAALLEVAERLADRPGLRLGFWAAEEAGLVGSRRYVRSLPRRERRRIAAYVNLDMVGSPRPRRMVYDTDDRVERVLREAVPGDEDETDVGGASDHAPFARADIPIGGLFTGAGERRGGRAADPCYHRRCDDLDNVDAKTAALLARAAQEALPRLRTGGAGG